MPHDKNGVEVKAGDVVRAPADGYIPHEKIGVVLSVQKGSDTCNLSIEAIGRQVQTGDYQSLPGVQRLAVSAKDCEILG